MSTKTIANEVAALKQKLQADLGAAHSVPIAGARDGTRRVATLDSDSSPQNGTS